MTILSIVFSLKQNRAENLHKKYHCFLYHQGDNQYFTSKYAEILVTNFTPTQKQPKYQRDFN
jgi:hypothetical protein